MIRDLTDRPQGCTLLGVLQSLHEGPMDTYSIGQGFLAHSPSDTKGNQVRGEGPLKVAGHSNDQRCRDVA